MADVFDVVVGQEAAVAQLRGAVPAPVHAYLLVGPPGAGSRALGPAFAAALLCPHAGCGDCRDCRLALAGEHPDVRTFAPEGAFLRREDAEEIIRTAMRSPVEGRRKVLLLTDMHRVQDAGPMLLKTIEEPPESTVFVVLADHVPPELVTIASRCARVDVPALPAATVEAALLADGAEAPIARRVAGVAAGDLDRARLLVADDRLVTRLDAWASVPSRLDGTGAAVVVLTDELRALVEESTGPLLARQKDELDQLEARVAARGERGSGRRRLEESHRRELRRHRVDELRSGLAVLARAYRDGVAAGPSPDDKAVLDGIDAVDRAAAALARNPNEALLLQSLLVRLPARR